MDIGVTLLSSIVTALITAIVTAYLATRRLREELQGKYDTDLRDKRLKVYSELWKSLEPLAKYSPPGPVTSNVVAQLSRSLRAWYFDLGGIYLSEAARDAYFKLQEALVASANGNGAGTDEPLDPVAYGAIYDRGSRLRTSLAYDIGTRRRLMSVN
jgi:hypothetical protein